MQASLFSLLLFSNSFVCYARYINCKETIALWHRGMYDC